MYFNLKMQNQINSLYPGSQSIWSTSRLWHHNKRSRSSWMRHGRFSYSWIRWIKKTNIEMVDFICMAMETTDWYVRFINLYLHYSFFLYSFILHCSFFFIVCVYCVLVSFSVLYTRSLIIDTYFLFSYFFLICFSFFISHFIFYIFVPYDLHLHNS